MAQLTLRIDDAALARIAPIVDAMSAKLGTSVARADALRVIFSRGLTETEKEHGIRTAAPPPQKGAKPARKP